VEVSPSARGHVFSHDQQGGWHPIRFCLSFKISQFKSCQKTEWLTRLRYCQCYSKGNNVEFSCSHCLTRTAGVSKQIHKADGMLPIWPYSGPENCITDNKARRQWTTHLNFFMAGPNMSLSDNGTVVCIWRMSVSSFQIYSFRVGADAYVRQMKNRQVGPFLLALRGIEVGVDRARDSKSKPSCDLMAYRNVYLYLYPVSHHNQKFRYTLWFPQSHSEETLSERSIWKATINEICTHKLNMSNLLAL